MIVNGSIFAGCVMTAMQTGAHFNMGLSVAVLIVENDYSKKKLWALLIYEIAELMGGFLGMTISYMFLGGKIAFIKPENLAYTVFYVFFLELFFTWLMMMVILHGKNAKLGLFKDCVVGITASLIGINFSAGCIGKKTGAVMNPNVGICNVVFCTLALGSTDSLTYLPAYIFGPLFGCVLAACFVKYVGMRFTPDEKKYEDESYIDDRLSTFTIEKRKLINAKYGIGSMAS